MMVQWCHPEKLFIEKQDIGKIIGKGGRVKRLLEKELEVKISVSRIGGVKIEGTPMQTYLAINVVSALILGFNIEAALQLKNHEFILEVHSIKDFAKSKSRQKEIKGRLIGTAGRVKEVIEELGGVELSVKDNKVALLGKIEDVAAARDAVRSLLRGAKHSRIYKWLEHKSRRYKE